MRTVRFECPIEPEDEVHLELVPVTDLNRPYYTLSEIMPKSAGSLPSIDSATFLLPPEPTKDLR